MGFWGTMAKVAFIGLGVMGYPMAGHLVKAGHTVTVWNRSQEKAARWVEQHKGLKAGTPKEAAASSELVMACVGNDDDLRSVVYGKAVLLPAWRKAASSSTTLQLRPMLPVNCMPRQRQPVWFY